MAEIKERDKSKKRNDILRAAESVFTGMGYERASMDKIAAKAGVSKRTVYNHFGSKEKLFETIIYDLLEQRRGLEAIPYRADKSLADQLRAFAEAEIYIIDSDKRLRLSRFLTITFLMDLGFQKRTIGKFPGIYGMLTEWLAAAKDDGRIKADDVSMAARIFYALVIGAITWPALFREHFDKQAARPLLDEIIGVFLVKYGCAETQATKDA